MSALIHSPPWARKLPSGNAAPYAHAGTQAQTHTYTAAHYAQHGKKNIQKTGSHKRLKDVRWGPQGGKFRSGKAENNQKSKKKKGNIWKAEEFKYSLHKWWFFFNEIYYIIFQRASIENTDLSATVMIRKLLKQQKAHIQAIPVQCSWDSLYSDSLRKKNRVLYTVGDHFKTDIRAYL